MANARVRSVDGLPLAGQLDGSEVLIASQQGAAVAVTAQKLAEAAALLVPPATQQIEEALSLKADKSELGTSAYINASPSGRKAVELGDASDLRVGSLQL